MGVPQQEGGGSLEEKGIVLDVSHPMGLSEPVTASPPPVPAAPQEPQAPSEDS
ncbi:hypothetical protein [Actinokineospora terrae]|uniref:Uncharacterized protein n=1 Tax=Actinokineospora terrae TaxID=155974 RepID=A0A1H9MTD1_9PSEU|nr:hypothetical protein [Actinokineospora terrae]SER26976.1 hypothetical protein SAMN04487818_102326 [Actinokineospora terrae]